MHAAYNKQRLLSYCPVNNATFTKTLTEMDSVCVHIWYLGFARRVMEMWRNRFKTTLITSYRNK